MDRLAVIHAESQRFADALAGTPPERRCPTCPDWSAADLLWHLTNVHFFWATILHRGVLDAGELQGVEDAKPPRPEGLTDLLVLREQATAALVEQLANRADDESCWSWFSPDQTVGFTRRMQTYEATMHRVDAELTAELPVTAIDADVAAGALDHAVDVMWEWMPDGATYSPLCTVEFMATDIGRSWLVDMGRWSGDDQEGGGARAVRATDGAPTATAVGSVGELALWAWTRGGSVDVSGDPASVAALNAVVQQGMQ